jgi:type VI secretion system protein ImpH
VLPGIPRRAVLPVDQRTVLGADRQRLGRNCFLGRRIADRMGKIRIRIAPVSAAEFQTWLPDGPRFGRIRTLVAIYLDQPLEWELEVVLADGEAATTRPGDSDRGRLGWNTWLFSNDSPKAGAGARFHPGPPPRGATATGSEYREFDS